MNYHTTPIKGYRGCRESLAGGAAPGFPLRLILTKTHLVTAWRYLGITLTSTTVVVSTSSTESYLFSHMGILGV